MSLWLCILYQWNSTLTFGNRLRYLFLYLIIQMTHSHIWLQNTNKASYCFSKFLWCSQSPYECLALYLLRRKHYFSFYEPLRFLFLYSFIHMTSNQASYCFSKLWWYSRSSYESLALYVLTRKLYFRFWKLVTVLVLILNHTHVTLSYLTPKH